MADQDPREPDHVEDGHRSDAGEPHHPAAARDAVRRPNYDRRQESISETRKPAGPPLDEATPTRDRPREDEREKPVDPA